MTQQEFQKQLADLCQEAFDAGNRISKTRVDQAFFADDLNGEEMKLVYDYLMAKKIVVKGYVKQEGGLAKSEEILLREDDRKYLDKYIADLASVPEAKAGEKEGLLQALGEGDNDARNRLMELYLKKILCIARELYTGEQALCDLVQEGNLCFLMALENLKTLQDQAAIEEELLTEVRQGIKAMTEEHTDVKFSDRRMVEKVEEFKNNVEILKQEYGRKVYLDEVADFMNISEDEAASILKLTGEEVGEDQEAN